ncbi:MAG: hypothetical protein ACK4MF_09330, partial [Hyphomicrobiaceae bacterium]
SFLNTANETKNAAGGATGKVGAARVVSRLSEPVFAIFFNAFIHRIVDISQLENTSFFGTFGAVAASFGCLRRQSLIGNYPPQHQAAPTSCAQVWPSRF